MFLKDQKCDVYFLQETYSEPNDENIWRSEWGGDIFFHMDLCILLNPSLNCTFENIHKDQLGRLTRGVAWSVEGASLKGSEGECSPRKVLFLGPRKYHFPFFPGRCFINQSMNKS